MSNARKIAATTIAAIAIAALGATPANAVRVIQTNDEPDRCANIRGHQGMTEFIYGVVRFKLRTPQPNDCRKVRRIHAIR